MGFSDGLLQMMSSIRFEGEWRQEERGERIRSFRMQSLSSVRRQ